MQGICFLQRDEEVVCRQPIGFDSRWFPPVSCATAPHGHRQSTGSGGRAAVVKSSALSRGRSVAVVKPRFNSCSRNLTPFIAICDHQPRNSKTTWARVGRYLHRRYSESR
jgi:hypothetical protein